MFIYMAGIFAHILLVYNTAWKEHDHSLTKSVLFGLLLDMWKASRINNSPLIYSYKS